MADIRQLVPQLHEMVWPTVCMPAADPWDSGGGTREERRAGSLGLLAIYSRLVKVLQRRIDLTIKDAVDAGADYGQIAAACGVSRQAVRQRWMRRTAGSRWYEVRLPYPRPHSWTGGRPRGGEPDRVVVVRLAGGPHDGARDLASPGEILMYEADGPSPNPPGSVPLLAWYVPSQDDTNVYVFVGAERDHRRTADTAGQRPGSAGRPKPRVYELAAEFNVESKIVMDQLKEMGEFVRSASSTVEHPVAQKLRERLDARYAEARSDGLSVSHGSPTEIPQVRLPGRPHKNPTDKAAFRGTPRHSC